MKPLLQLQDFSVSHGPVEAVRGISFQVERGEVFGLLGPNGAGKTTTVEILEGYRRPSSGEVRILGHDPQSRDRELQQRVGIVLQNCGFYPRVTVHEALEHFGKPYANRRDARETIELVVVDRPGARVDAAYHVDVRCSFEERASDDAGSEEEDVRTHGAPPSRLPSTRSRRRGRARDPR